MFTLPGGSRCTACLMGNVIPLTGDTEIAPTGELVSKRRGDLRIARRNNLI